MSALLAFARTITPRPVKAVIRSAVNRRRQPVPLSRNGHAGLSNLSEVSSALSSVGVDWWLTAGTCLGLIREEGFIGHDTDIDIGVRESDLIDEVTTRLRALGFDLEETLGTPEVALQLCFRKRGVKVDLFVYYDDGQNLWHAVHRQVSGEWRYRRYVFDRDLFAAPLAASFGDVPVRIPNPPEDYLAAHYGENWRTPIKQWDWWTSPLCLDQTLRSVEEGAP
jgi:hypothetical protein